MKINSLTLINYRKFKHQSFVFNDHFTALIGDNATGKTQILEAIVTLFSEYQFRMMRKNLSKAKEGDMEIHTEITVSDVHHEHHHFDSSENKHSVRMEYIYPSILSATINDKEYVFCRRDNASDEVNVRDSVLKRIAQDNLAEIQKQANINLPVLAYYGTCRLWNKKNTLKKGIPSRTDGYRWSLDSFVDFEELKEWFKKQELIQLQKGTNGTVLEVMGEALSKMIPGCKSVFYDLELEDLALRFRDDMKLPFADSELMFNELSDGYRMVLTMVFDIVKQMLLLNPHLEDRVLNETDGIILIDELDLSLHPKWQRIVVNALKQTFPKVQFIVTTHSPFIIQSLVADEVIDLTECKGIIIKGHWERIKEDAGKISLPLIIKDGDLIDEQSLGVVWPQVRQSEQVGKSIEDITEYVMDVNLPQRSARLQKMYEVAKEYYAKLKELNGASSQELQRLDKELTELIAPFSADVAYHAFLEMERLTAMQKREKTQQ